MLLRTGYLGMPLKIIDVVFNCMVSVRKKSVFHILYFRDSWISFPSIVSILHYGKADFYSLPMSSLNTWGIQGDYIHSFVSFNTESRSGSIILDSWLLSMNIIPLSFQSANFALCIHSSVQLVLNPLPLPVSVRSPGFKEWLVPKFMEHCALNLCYISFNSISSAHQWLIHLLNETLPRDRHCSSPLHGSSMLTICNV